MGAWEGIIWAARVAQVIFALIVLGTCAYAVSVINQALNDDGLYGYSFSQINFMIFNAVWTLLVVGYQLVVPRFSDKLGHKFVVLGVDALTAVFWFAGFIALSVWVGAFPNGPGFYRALQTACAFGAFAWIAFMITTVLSAINVFRGNTGSAKHGDPMGHAVA